MRRDVCGLSFGQPGMSSAMCILTQHVQSLGLDPGTRQLKLKIFWTPVVGSHKAWPARVPVSTIVAEIKRLYSSYSFDDPRRFASVAIDRESGSAIVRTFRELLGAIGVGVRALPVTEEKTDYGCRREDLLFSLRNAVDQGYLKVAPDSDWLYALDSSIKWHATDSDVLGRSCCLAWKLACLPPVGERVAAIV